MKSANSKSTECLTKLRDMRFAVDSMSAMLDVNPLKSGGHRAQRQIGMKYDIVIKMFQSLDRVTRSRYVRSCHPFMTSCSLRLIICVIYVYY